MRDQNAAYRRITLDRSGYGALYPIHLINVLLMVVTLTIYRFWAVTRVRRFLWPRVRFDGQPLEYTGNGLEIFIGFLKVFFFILLPMWAVVIFMQTNAIDVLSDPETSEENNWNVGFDAILSLFFFTVFPFVVLGIGQFLSLRYRASRTTWRGIRGKINGSVIRYLMTAALAGLAMVFSAGLLTPLAHYMIFKFIVERSRLGSASAISSLRVGPFFISVLVALAYSIAILFCGLIVFGLLFFLAVLLGTGFGTLEGALTFKSEAASIPIIVVVVMFYIYAGLANLFIYATYKTRIWRHIAESTKLLNLEFRYTATYFQLWKLWMGNILILIFSLGLLAPMVWRRRFEFFSQHILVKGELDEATIRQIASDEGSLAGEGLLGDFDVA